MFWKGFPRIVFFIAAFPSALHLQAREACKDITFFAEDKGGYLEKHVNQSITTESQSLCRVMCYLSDSCISYNYHQATGICEINDSDHIQHPNDLIRRPGFVYHATKNGCPNPCPANTTCRANLVTGKYYCFCPFEYSESAYTECDPPYQKVGCFRDSRNPCRALPNMILTSRDSTSFAYEKPPYDKLYEHFNKSINWFVSRCAAIAKERQFKVFGVQNDFECWSGPGGENTYNKHGKAGHSDCLQGYFKRGCDKNIPQVCFAKSD